MNRKSTDRLFIAGLLAVLMVAGCGGGSGSPEPLSNATPPPVPETPQNAQPVVVDAGPTNTRTVNLVYTTVTVCAPNNSSNCQKIDHILVDTGSSGLRLMASVLSPALALPQVVDATGKGVVECMQFADGFSWGPVKAADIKVAGEFANSVPIQVIGDPAFSAIPSACASTGPSENTVETFGSNGIIGVGHFVEDCGPVCAQVPHVGLYYLCSGVTCESAAVPLTQQVPNPVARFATDNNGVVISLPPVPPSGVPSVGGTILFGIGTQTNNGIGSAKVISLDPNTGQFTTVFNNKSYPESFIDSGSNGLFFSSSGLPSCNAGFGFYCPPVPQDFSALIQGRNGINATVDFRVGNAAELFAANGGTSTAFDNLAGPNPNPNSFDWGLPFFYGRNVYTAIEGRNTPAGMGPYVAF